MPFLGLAIHRRRVLVLPSFGFPRVLLTRLLRRTRPNPLPEIRKHIYTLEPYRYPPNIHVLRSKLAVRPSGYYHQSVPDRLSPD
ncbi:hypothetical protein BOTBODRAFT_250806 [Botryobasidium botryosum FD-172 SS1]|uniref:Uncharacterized protein n=1 Tax=Botryobasidium botryosum (strain FD-172 SS1) TaxID=930990 RepID=A0A067MP40_BOTB1|nr:hypothetical protein BOTBODRAFT_250806 [Botryobasidium botryosum FD-172 SS1]